MGIDPPSLIQTFTNKHNFRQLAMQLDIPIPKILDETSACNFDKVIIKPADSFSGRGITTLAKPTPAELSDAAKTASTYSPTRKFIIEEFVEGQLFSHSAFFDKGLIIADFIVREDCISSPFAVDASYVDHSFPSDIRAEYRNEILKISQSLRIENGLIHTQFILKNQKYWLLEATRRCPGDLYSLLIEKSTGYPYNQSYLAPFIGKRTLPFDEFYPTNENWITRFTLCPSSETFLESIKFSQPVWIEEFFPLQPMGTKLPSGPSGRAGIFFFKSSHLEEHHNLYNDILNGVLCTFD